MSQGVAKSFAPASAILGRFLVVGLSGTLVNLAVLWLLVKVGLPQFGAAAIATEVSIINNFAWNDSWTFKATRKTKQTIQNVAGRFLRFQLVTSLTALLTLGLFSLFTNIFNIYYLLAQFVAIGIATLLNFWINSKFTWKSGLSLSKPSYNHDLELNQAGWLIGDTK